MDFAAVPNLVSLFLTRAAEGGDAPFLWAKHGGRWVPISWREAAEHVSSLAAGLAALGIAPGERVMLVAENRPDWCLADLAIMAAGAVTVPTYTTNTADDHRHILTDSGAAAVIVSDRKLAGALAPALRETPGCRHLIGFAPLDGLDAGTAHVHLLADLLAAHPADVAATTARATARREELACIIYTSGTGGAPRGVRQHHGAILHNVAGCAEVIGQDFRVGADESFLSFLPLSHAYEHSAGQYLPIGLGGQIYYTEGLDRLAANMAEVKPSVMVVVPRLFEVLRTRIRRAIEAKGKLPTRLLGLALVAAERRAAGRTGLFDPAIRAVVARTLAPEVRARFGGRLKALVSGGAPLNPEVGRFFEALGITLLQGYGQTEAGPVISVNRPKTGIRHESVGTPLSGTEVRIAAEDGEILVRGENVMHGYWQRPEESAAVLRDGWLHTGDVGRLDAGGRLVITDRARDIIVNDKGDNVSPARVEGMLTLAPEIAQAMVVGDRRPYLVALLVPDAEWAAGFAGDAGLPAALDRLREHDVFRRALSAAIDRVNVRLPVAEKVRRWALADEAFAIGNRQLTPSLKPRRHEILRAYAGRLDALYGD